MQWTSPSTGTPATGPPTWAPRITVPEVPPAPPCVAGKELPDVEVRTQQSDAVDSLLCAQVLVLEERLALLLTGLDALRAELLVQEDDFGEVLDNKA